MVKIKKECTRCTGTGAIKYHTNDEYILSLVPCDYCDGRGFTTFTVNPTARHIIEDYKCSHCNDRGYINVQHTEDSSPVKEPCKKCNRESLSKRLLKWVGRLWNAS